MAESQPTVVARPRLIYLLIVFLAAAEQSRKRPNCAECKPTKIEKLENKLPSIEDESTDHRHTIDKYLDTLLANQRARKELPPTIAKNRPHRPQI